MGVLIIDFPNRLLLAPLGALPGARIRTRFLADLPLAWDALPLVTQAALKRRGIGPIELTRALRQAYWKDRNAADDDERALGPSAEDSRRQPKERA